MKEQRIVGLRVLDQPVHSSDDVALGGLRHGVLLVVCEDNHVFPSVAKVVVEVRRHVLHIVNATSQLPSLAKVIDANQESLSPSRAIGIAKVVALRCSVAETLHAARRGRRGVVVSLHIGVRVDGWKAFFLI